MVSQRTTRKKSSNSGFLHVRSMPHIKMLEKMMKKKNTLVYVYAPWCGACAEFDHKVMNHVQSLKNKTVNIAKVDSKLASKTGLPPVQYLPTLMYVENGKPKTFTGEDGTPTTVMPRGNSLDEERQTLTTFVQNPRNSVSNREPGTMATLNTLSSATPGKMSLPSYNKEGSPARSNVTVKSLAKSPYDEYINGMPTPSEEKEEDQMFTPIKSTIKSSIPVSNPPDIGADLIASQGRNSMSKPRTTGGMLQAIRQKTNSLNALTRLRKTRRN